MFGIAKKLHSEGVLGINARNRDYVMAYNPRHCYPLVDDKLKSKKLAQAAGIAVPELYGVIKTIHDLSSLEDILQLHPSCVIKPTHGSGGNGVLVLTGKRKNRLVKSNGMALDITDVVHVGNLAGNPTGYRFKPRRHG